MFQNQITLTLFQEFFDEKAGSVFDLRIEELRHFTLDIENIIAARTDDARSGWMNPEIWVGMEQTLREQGVLTAPLNMTQVLLYDAVSGGIYQ
jgi:hypothetical protein